MSLKEEINKELKQLSLSQRADYEYSLAWKEIGYKFLCQSDHSNFQNAVHWVGKTGNVSRSVSNKKLKVFSDFIWNNKQKIEDGSFSLVQLEELSKTIGKRPLSWTSKICHILNPNNYPIIFDTNIRKALRLKSEDEFLKKVEELANKYKTEEKELLYKYDSSLWASVNK